MLINYYIYKKINLSKSIDDIFNQFVVNYLYEPIENNYNQIKNLIFL